MAFLNQAPKDVEQQMHTAFSASFTELKTDFLSTAIVSADQKTVEIAGLKAQKDDVNGWSYKSMHGALTRIWTPRHIPLSEQIREVKEAVASDTARGMAFRQVYTSSDTASTPASPPVLAIVRPQAA
jgi:hypothetical protein